MSGAEQRLCLYTDTELKPVLQRMAQQASQLFLPGRPLHVVGLLRRGEPLARMLAERLRPLLGLTELPVIPLRVKRYADDLSLLHRDTLLEENQALSGLELAGTPLLLVDDVLYGGHSLLRSCAYLSRLGADEIRTAVLVDRCVSSQPVHADVCGVRLQIVPGDIIDCCVPPYEAEFRIELCRR
ncbi:phosphoribosyltransferase [Azotobacter beijerinckii]|uniref:Pyrimidine operon attenuation protein / uracil phosphoribosyltransferase n=1 Tax=Azotobacter beijerinckii TaxID=170623 RepID=A0A1I3ZHG4_9GAMM|nr:phosphoribosyltransferase [Azotobacter beijerinckii]SFB32703.1 pyrimidine operon attenuation protein / uracil phosphoribosyltransferase [Azotobacter beijerinckii]SFK43472.1 pyrimidine operon attenuation protein / uracil phosphoribosyltransferase [Azotobacter beijerinckii]